MKEHYKSALNKISVDDSYESQLKARLAREQARIDMMPKTEPKSHFRVLMAAATAAAVLLTVISAYFAVPAVLKSRESAVVPEAEVSSVYTPTSSGYNSISLAQDLSFRYVPEESAVDYDANIYFRFVGFDEYDINLRESCIVFNTKLDSAYTLANFFEDYYNLIVNGTGITQINNGMLDSMFDIRDNGIQMISVYDEYREITDLDTALMSDYSDMSDIYFTVTVTHA